MRKSRRKRTRFVNVDRFLGRSTRVNPDDYSSGRSFGSIILQECRCLIRFDDLRHICWDIERLDGQTRYSGILVNVVIGSIDAKTFYLEISMKNFYWIVSREIETLDTRLRIASTCLNQPWDFFTSRCIELESISGSPFGCQILTGYHYNILL